MKITDQNKNLLEKYQHLQTDSENLYIDIVEECAQLVEHIRTWDTNLGDHIRSKMGIL